jgi:hypothetical protein
VTDVDKVSEQDPFIHQTINMPVVQVIDRVMMIPSISIPYYYYTILLFYFVHGCACHKIHEVS